MDHYLPCFAFTLFTTNRKFIPSKEQVEDVMRLMDEHALSRWGYPTRELAARVLEQLAIEGLSAVPAIINRVWFHSSMWFHSNKEFYSGPQYDADRFVDRMAKEETVENIEKVNRAIKLITSMGISIPASMLFLGIQGFTWNTEFKRFNLSLQIPPHPRLEMEQGFEQDKYEYVYGRLPEHGGYLLVSSIPHSINDPKEEGTCFEIIRDSGPEYFFDSERLTKARTTFCKEHGRFLNALEFLLDQEIFAWVGEGWMMD